LELLAHRAEACVAIPLDAHGVLPAITYHVPQTTHHPTKGPAMRRPFLLLLLAAVAAPPARADDPWVVYEGTAGPGKGKHVVLISGDEEYRSEETLPALGKILARHHGFKCTVLFAIDPKTGEIDPNRRPHNIPGLEHLKTADLMVIFT